MTNPNDFAFSDIATRLQEISKDGIKAYHPPITKLEYFAAHSAEPLPNAFCIQYIIEKDKTSTIRKTMSGDPYEALTLEEKIEVRSLWRVKCAMGLINALNKQQ